MQIHCPAVTEYWAFFFFFICQTGIYEVPETLAKVNSFFNPHSLNFGPFYQNQSQELKIKHVQTSIGSP